MRKKNKTKQEAKNLPRATSANFCATLLDEKIEINLAQISRFLWYSIEFFGLVGDYSM